MRKLRVLDVVNPSAFFIVMYVFYLILIQIVNFISVSIFSFELIRFPLSEKTVSISFLYLFVFVFSSYILAPQVFGYSPKFNIKESITDLNEKKVWLLSLASIAIFILAHAYYFLAIGFIPALHPDAAIIRVTAKSGFGGILLLANGLCYAAILLLSTIYKSQNLAVRYFTIFILFLCIVVIALEGFRGPAASLGLLFLISVYSQSDRYTVSKGIGLNLVLYGLLLVICLSLIDVLRHGSQLEIASLMQTFWTMTVNLFNLNEIIKYFEYRDFFYGETFITDIAVAIPGIDSQFLGVKLVSLIGLSFAGEGMTVTAPGEGYVNFGYAGVVLHAMFLGMIAELLFRMLHQRKGTSSRMLLVFYSYCFSKISVAGIMPTLIFTLVPTLLFLLPLVFFAKRS